MKPVNLMEVAHNMLAEYAAVVEKIVFLSLVECPGALRAVICNSAMTDIVLFEFANAEDAIVHLDASIRLAKQHKTQSETTDIYHIKRETQDIFPANGELWDAINSLRRDVEAIHSRLNRQARDMG